MSRRGWWGAGIVLVLAAAIALYFVTRGSDDTADATDASRTTATHPVVPAIGKRSAATVVATVAPDAPGTLRLEGQVVDEQKQPVGGATVFLDPGEKLITTELDGSFAFDGLHAQRYLVVARKDDLFSDSTRVRVSDRTEPVILVMRRGATLAITVDDGSAPVVGAKVVLDRFVTTITDERGLATLGGLGPRFHSARITADGFAPARVSITLGEFPGEVIERRVTLLRGAPLSGIVLGPDNKPVPAAQVGITGPNSLTDGVTANAKGEWTFPAIPKGTFSLRATSDTFGAEPALVVEHDGAAPRTGIVLRVIVGAQLVGIVTDEAGGPVAGASISLSVGMSSKYTDRTDHDGRFALLGIDAGTYSVLARSSRSASPITDVTIANNERVELRLVVKESSIAGVVVDPTGEPVAQARVQAKPVTGRGGYADDVTDSHGRFDLGGIPEGTYKVSASWAEHDDRRLGVGEEIVTGTRDAKIVLPLAATLTGRVMFGGAPMPYYGVLIRERPEFSFIGAPTSVRASDGRFTLRGIHPGTWGIVVIGPGTARKIVKDIKLDAGKTTDIGDVVMERGIHVRGHVRDSSGSPVAGATVSTVASYRLADRESAIQSWFKGYYSTTTSASGAYSFDGIAPLFNARRPVTLTASHETHGTSATTDVPAGDPAILDLVLLASGGGIDGVIEGRASTTGLVSATRNGTRENMTADVGDGGRFSFENLAPGVWTLKLRDPGQATPPPVEVAVVANERAKATLVMPKVTVTVKLKIVGACKFAILLPPGTNEHDMVGMGECKRSPVEIEKVAPGAYRACADDACVPITVAESPASQVFELRAKP